MARDIFHLLESLPTDVALSPLAIDWRASIIREATMKAYLLKSNYFLST